MDTYIQTGLGVLVSIILFLVGYRQTIGAKKERTKNANHAIHRSILRRMVLEDYSPKYKDISRIVEGKAREFRVSVNDILSGEQILNNLYTEVFDNELISPIQRKEIEKKLDDIFDFIEEELPKTDYLDFEQIRQEKRERFNYVTAMIMTVSIIGTISSLLLKFGIANTFKTEWILSGLGVFITSIAAISFINLFRKKDLAETPSRQTVHIAASEFENEILKIMEKLKLNYTIEPNLGRIRPDFLIESNNKKIVIEAKAWNNLVSLNQIRRTVDYLTQLSSDDEINKVVLVTKKKPPSSLLNQIKNDKISAVSISNLSSILKESV